MMSVFQWQREPASTVEAGGKVLEYACYGTSPDEAPTIVMLHEGLGCLARWRDFPEKVAAVTGCGAFACSRSGYGHSDAADLPRPLDYMTREAVDILPELLDRIGLRRGILLGHSDGATIAAIYAGSVIDHRMRGLVLMAPHFFTEPMRLAEIDRTKQAYDTGDLKERLARYHRNVDNTFNGWADCWLNPDFASWNVAEVIGYLRIPVLAIQGKDDEYGTLAQIREIEERIYSPVDTVLLDACRHALHIDQTEQSLGDFAVRLKRIEAAQVEMV